MWESIGNIALTSFNALHNWFVRAITNSNHFILPIRRKANTTYAWRLLSFSSLTNMFVLCCRYHCRSFVTRVYPEVPVACHFVRRRIKIASTNKNCVQVTISNVLQEWSKNKVLPMSLKEKGEVKTINHHTFWWFASPRFSIMKKLLIFWWVRSDHARSHVKHVLIYTLKNYVLDMYLMASG